jgi:hypothetical protein
LSRKCGNGAHEAKIYTIELGAKVDVRAANTRPSTGGIWKHCYPYTRPSKTIPAQGWCRGAKMGTTYHGFCRTERSTVRLDGRRFSASVELALTTRVKCHGPCQSAREQAGVLHDSQLREDAYWTTSSRLTGAARGDRGADGQRKAR